MPFCSATLIVIQRACKITMMSIFGVDFFPFYSKSSLELVETCMSTTEATSSTVVSIIMNAFACLSGMADLYPK